MSMHSSSKILISPGSEHSTSSSEIQKYDDFKSSNNKDSPSSRGCISYSSFELSKKSQDDGKSKGVVRFKSVKVRRTISRAHFSLAEKERYWWTAKEYQFIKHSCISRIQELEMESGPVKQNFCIRGLETYFRSNSNLRSLNRKEALMAVLAEQDQQRRTCAQDPKAIAECYHKVSAPSQIWAHRVGVQDAKAIEEHDDGTSVERRRSVHFQRTSQERPTLNRSNYTKNEMSKYWYSQSETENILKSCAKDIQTVERLSQAKMLELSGSSCLRGLESQTAEERHARTSLRKQAYRAVFEILPTSYLPCGSDALDLV